jgi:hypothetical protein
VPDNESGSGRVDAVAAIQRTLPRFTGVTTLAVDANGESGATLTPAQLGFSDLASCGQTRLAWTGGCGTGPGSTLTCPRGTTTVSVSASTNGVTFSAPVELRITVR